MGWLRGGDQGGEIDQQHGLLGGRLSRVEGGQRTVGTWGTKSGMGVVGEAVCPRHSSMLLVWEDEGETGCASGGQGWE